MDRGAVRHPLHGRGVHPLHAHVGGLRARAVQEDAATVSRILRGDRDGIPNRTGTIAKIRRFGQVRNQHIPVHNATGFLLCLFRFRRREFTRRGQTLLPRYQCSLVFGSASCAAHSVELGEESEISNAGFSGRFHIDVQRSHHHLLLHVARTSEYVVC